MADADNLIWHKVADLDELADGRVKTATAGTVSLALVHLQGQYVAMDNKCPHQGGPLGEGTIERMSDGTCLLRCPWHGWDFDPLTGKPPGGHEDKGQELFPVETREDGIYAGVPPETSELRTVTDVMAETMVNWGISRVFGMVGHSNLGLAEALRHQEEAGNMSFIGIRHEGAASFACSAYGKLTGRPAACLSIAGPGATNLLTGLWDAKVDRAPVLALTGQVQVQVFGPGAFQEIDLASAFEPVARFSQTVLHSSDHAELTSLACKTAIVERDVAHLIFPDDVQTVPAGDAKAATPSGRLGDTRITPSDTSINSALSVLGSAKRPVIIVGYGARHAMDDIAALAEKLKAPIVTTFKAKGILPDSHAHAGGVLGRSGTPIASYFMNEADWLLVFGASFSNHTGIETKKKIIQVDFERMQLGKFHPVDIPIWGEIGQTANAFLRGLPDDLDCEDQVPQIAERWSIWRKEKDKRAGEDKGEGLNAASVFAALSALAADDAIVAVDVGNNTYSFGRYFECKHQSVLMSGYLGSIGYGFPAAMGAWAATQDFEAFQGRQVMSVSGDGGFGQYAMEFTTAVKYGMNVTHILLNNNELGKISKEQRAGNWQVWQTSLHNPSFADFASSCGGLGLRVESKSDIEAAIKKALAHDGPALVEFMMDVDLV